MKKLLAVLIAAGFVGYTVGVVTIMVWAGTQVYDDLKY